MIRFFFWLLTAALVIAGLTLLADSGGFFQKPSFFFKTLLFNSFTTAIVFVYLYKARNGSHFIQLYLFTMVLKVIAYLVYNLIMVLEDKPSAMGNVVFFLVTYFIFTAIEIGLLYRKINGQNQSGNEGKNF